MYVQPTFFPGTFWFIKRVSLCACVPLCVLSVPIPEVFFLRYSLCAVLAFCHTHAHNFGTPVFLFRCYKWHPSRVSTQCHAHKPTYQRMEKSAGCPAAGSSQLKSRPMPCQINRPKRPCILLSWRWAMLTTPVVWLLETASLHPLLQCTEDWLHRAGQGGKCHEICRVSD